MICSTDQFYPFEAVSDRLSCRIILLSFFYYRPGENNITVHKLCSSSQLIALFFRILPL